MKSAALLALLLAVPAVAASPSGITDASLKADTAMLASDAFEGRRPGTPGGDKAVDYITARMRALGLKPGNHGQWTQDVPLVTITTAPTPLMFEPIAGNSPNANPEPSFMSYGTDVVLWTKRQVAAQTLASSPVVFVGYGITAPELGWDDYAGADVRGKTVIVLVNDPDWQTPAAGKDAGPFEGRAMTYYGRYTYKFEEAARHGAAAAFVVHDTEPAGYGWNVITTSWTGPQIDLDTSDKGMSRVGIEGWISKAAFERTLAAAAEKDLASLTKAAQVKGFRAVPLGLAASAKLTNSISLSASKNVIGVVPGTKRPDETVFFTAHWDHLGRCPADKSGDDICNGAVDNASGVAGVLALAQAFAAGPKPDRTVVFMSVTGEESGLLGSRWYAEHPVYPLALTAGGINMDVMNVGGRTRDIVLRGGNKSGLDDLLAAAARDQDRTVAAESNPEKGGYFRSDHFSFAKLGVPVASAGSGVDRLDGGKAAGQAAADDYTAHRYHQPSDNYDPTWDWSGAVEDLDLYYAIGRKLADDRVWPQWNAGNAFKAVRDATAGERR